MGSRDQWTISRKYTTIASPQDFVFAAHIHHTWVDLNVKHTAFVSPWSKSMVKNSLASDLIWEQQPTSSSNWSLQLIYCGLVVCCPTAPSHFLNQHCLIISEVLWHPPECNITGYAQDICFVMSVKIVDSKLQLYLPGANELTTVKVIRDFTVSHQPFGIMLLAWWKQIQHW